MAGPYLPVWSLSRSQAVRIGNAQGGVTGLGSGGRVLPQLTQNPSSAALPNPFLVDLSDGASRRDLAHHIAIGNIIPATPLRLTNSLAANTAAIGVTETVVNQLVLPPNVLVPGAVIRFTVQGQIGTANAATFKVRLGVAGTTADTQVATVTSAAPGGATGFIYDALVTCQVAGAGTAGKVVGNAQVALHNGSLQLTNNTAQIGIDTTVSNFIDLTVTGGAATSVTVVNSLIEYVDQTF